MIPRVAYALFTVSAPFAALALANAGLRLDLSVLIVVNLTGTMVGSLERRFAPYEREWNRSRGDNLVDVLHLAISTVAMTWLFEMGSQWLPSFGVWPVALPFVAQMVLALLIAELAGYWVHRWQHEWSTFGRLHLVHHSAQRLHALNSSRNHPLDSMALLIAAGTPLVLLGCPARVIAALGAYAIAHLQFQHSNTTLALGPLNWVFAGPELHRWHHSRVPEDANGNYGHVLIVWDVVFGTRQVPAGRPPVDVGLFDGANLPERYGAQLAAPFTFNPTADGSR